MFKSQTWIIAKNTYNQRLRGASFWIMLLTPIVLFIGYIGLIYYVANSTDNTRVNIAVINQPALTKALSSSQVVKADYSDLSKKEAQRQIEKGKIDAYLEENNGSYSLTSAEKSDNKINENLLEQALKSVNMLKTAQSLNLSQTEVANLLVTPKIAMKTWSSSGEKETDELQKSANNWTAMIALVVIFMFLSIYAGIVAQEIGNEKSNRIMETLLAASSAKAQYYGKVAGVILLAVTQALFYVAGSALIYFFIKDNSYIKPFLALAKNISPSFLIYIFFMTIIGILGYLFLAAIVASLVNEQAQVQQAVQPIIYFSMIGYFIGIFAPFASENVLIKVLSFVPFISPTLMTSNFAVQQSSTAEAFIALAIQLIATCLVAVFGVKVYSRNVLSYSDEKIVRQFFRNLRGKGDFA